MVSARNGPRPDASSVGDLVCARDRALVRRIVRGESVAAEALAALFDNYAPTALALARRVTQQNQLAEEVVQEAFLALWTSPGSYDPAKGTVRAFLLTSVHHLAVDAVRREETQRRRRDAEGASRVEHGTDVAEEFAERAEVHGRRSAVSSALARLPAEQLQVLQMMYFDGKTQQVIAEELALPLGTVKSRSLLAMRKLRALLVAPTWRGAG